MKNKTVATWLAFLGGPLGLHRFYLHGIADTLGWLLPIPTALGLYGIERVQQYGVDDRLSWWLIPLLGFTIAVCFADRDRLRPGEPRNAGTRATTQAPTREHVAGGTHWITIAAVMIALMVGTGVLMASIAFSFQRYFEVQVQEGLKISQ